MVGYQVTAEESLESESHDKSPTPTHDTELHGVGDQEHVDVRGDLELHDVGDQEHVAVRDDLELHDVGNQEHVRDDLESHGVGDQENVVNRDELDDAEGHLKAEGGSHDGVIISGMSLYIYIYSCDGWMDVLRFYILFNSIPIISA